MRYRDRLAELISEKVREGVRIHGSASKMAELVHEPAGVKQITAVQKISQMRRGSNGYIPSPKGHYRGQMLYRIGLILEISGTEESDEVIKLAREEWPDFIYPPSSDGKIRERRTLDNFERLKPEHKKLVETVISRILENYEEQNDA